MDTEVRPVDKYPWQHSTGGLENVWKWLRTVPDACIEHTSSGCKTKCAAVNASKHYGNVYQPVVGMASIALIQWTMNCMIYKRL